MGRAEMEKGRRREAEFARLVGGQRVPLSGAIGGEFAQDVALSNGWRGQVKSRANGWRTLPWKAPTYWPLKQTVENGS